jgi:nucleotide-binding universal stress UspA family protein
MLVPPTAMPVYVDMYKGPEEIARKKLAEIAATKLYGVKCELLTEMAEPGTAIVAAAKHLNADVIVMATHGRRGISHFFSGSVSVPRLDRALRGRLDISG